MPHTTIWSPEIATGLPAMDELHHAFCDAMARLSALGDEEFRLAYPDFICTTERTFATEEEWMEEIDFPTLKSHREQHARVLSALHHSHSMVEIGDLAPGRKIVDQLLPDWFSLHTATMDMTLALALQAPYLASTPSEAPAYA